ncbi:response regulator transcription factor [Streptomyces clavuligerus]|uniref:Two component transcriptional regulator, LuxR family protein n=2 Tax=Streptomyces clavuligerus TaxID=1901 RepID=B5GY72_STRCL|nr:response regulator transcription factor [Streptomyces clavuligerus]ANW21947.1 DNA-binding response regulator [Streptomyces clavuligerus]AXU16569.1 DNA-binding response regulator [Streptomyces clavuligerus]EDY51279.1 two component transcriptional regulator [Streptomyces clavuligerus]EFG07804.1 two component transcriptional regulator, LuxR family protein [Streptomyces clavuligerus]MBY6303990.1 response regulator transcription factor [Streptomyces clavuligerus]
MTIIRVLIADDQEMVRGAFRMILDSQPDMEVVAEAADGATAVELARSLRPDVCLLDIRMPELDGLEATRLLAGPAVPQPFKVIVATTFDLDEYVYRALRNGACGFLLKDGSPTLLTEAVRAAAAGGSLISPTITVRLLRHMASPEPDRNGRPAAEHRAPARLSEPLTERELDVIRRVARGRTNEEVAAELYVTLSTVKTHLGNVQRKLSARNRVEIAAWAWENGLV